MYSFFSNRKLHPSQAIDRGLTENSQDTKNRRLIITLSPKGLDAKASRCPSHVRRWFWCSKLLPIPCTMDSSDWVKTESRRRGFCFAAYRRRVISEVAGILAGRRRRSDPGGRRSVRGWSCWWHRWLPWGM